MTPLRFSMLTATLLAFAVNVSAQTPQAVPSPQSDGLFWQEVMQKIRAACMGCNSADAQKEPAELGAPTGTYVRGFQEIQANKAAATAYVFFLDEWYMGGPLLGPHGIRHLLQVAERLPGTRQQVQIQPSPDPDLNDKRRLTVIAALLEKGVTDAKTRVVLAFPQAEALDGQEAERIYMQMLRPPQSQFGFGLGYGGGKLGSCATGAAGTVKCCETAKAPASCCCAKACGCCESCKEKKSEAHLPKVGEVIIIGGCVLSNPLADHRYFPPLPMFSPAGPIGIASPPLCPVAGGFKDVLVKVQETRTGGLMLGAGVNCDNGVVGDIILNERNFDDIARQQADRDLKIAEFYLRTGHPGAATFYYELVMLRHGPEMPPPLPVPYQTVQVQAIPMAPPSCTGPMAIALPFSYPPAPPMPVPPPPAMAHRVVQVQAIASAGGTRTGYRSSGTLVPDLNIPICNSTFVPTQPQFGVHTNPRRDFCNRLRSCKAKHAHLVTPDFEAHCQRMTHRGDTIILEGDVILLNKKHAQPIRIEAHRVIVNMKDGTFTVESEARPTVSGFGVQRTSAVPPSGAPSSNTHEQLFQFWGSMMR